jgi:hypothetical protein
MVFHMTTRRKPKPLTGAQRKEAGRLGLPIIDGEPYDYGEKELDYFSEGLKLDGAAIDAARKARMAARNKES